MNNYRIVEIEWFDAQSSMEAWTIEELKEQLKPLHTFSVGYLIEDNKEYVIIGFVDFGNGLIKHHQCIPKKMIKRIRILKNGKRRI